MWTRGRTVTRAVSRTKLSFEDSILGNRSPVRVHRVRLAAGFDANPVRCRQANQVTSSVRRPNDTVSSRSARARPPGRSSIRSLRVPVMNRSERARWSGGRVCPDRLGSSSTECRRGSRRVRASLSRDPGTLVTLGGQWVGGQRLRSISMIFLAETGSDSLRVTARGLPAPETRSGRETLAECRPVHRIGTIRNSTSSIVYSEIQFTRRGSDVGPSLSVRRSRAV